MSRSKFVTLASDPLEDARAAGLRYVSQLDDGIQRRRRGRGYVYIDPRGKIVRDARTRLRIEGLVIPPAWKDVRICPDARGHLQAVGIDKRGRKQYRYHPKWRQTRDETKYHRMIPFAKALPKIRRKIRHDLRLPGLPRQKVLATVIELLQTTLIRVGNREYARQNHSYGLTTLRNKHVRVNGSAIHFEFRGKSGIEHAIDLKDRRLAKIIRACQHLPGQELFQYVDADGTRHAVASEHVNDYLRDVAGDEFTAKDFRTWSGTVLACAALRQCGAFTSQAQARRNAAAAIEAVAKELGNTRTVCRKCYIHPAVLGAYLDGTLLESLERCKGYDCRGLRAHESAVLAFLKSALQTTGKSQR